MLLASYECEILREAGPTRLKVLAQEVAMCSGKRWIKPRQGFTLQWKCYTEVFLSCLELLLSSKLQVREKIKCKVLERVCDWFKCGCEYVGQH